MSWRTKEQARVYQRAYYQAHKKAMREYARNWHRTHNNREQLNKDQRVWRHRLKIEVLTYYSMGEELQCARCGIKDIDVLCLDHIEGGGRKDRQKRDTVGGYKLYQQLKRESFPAGYQTLCFNCNIKKKIVEGK